jgi:hypothetical protein
MRPGLEALARTMHDLASAMPGIHTKIYNPYLKSPDMLVEHEGKQYRPLVFTLTRGRSDPVHYVFSYLRDQHTIYFVRKQDQLVEVESPLLDSFAAVFWSVARDAEHVYHGERRARSIKHPTRFRLFEPEAHLYFDGEYYYDDRLAIVPLDAPTLALVELSPAHRLRSWSVYNDYLASIHRPLQPFECSLIYSYYLVDRNGLYKRNPTTHHIWPIESEKVSALLRAPLSEDGQDLMTFVEKNPHVRSYDWLAATTVSHSSNT